MTTGSADQRPLWVCPHCGARLVTRNMWHSCGRWTLEELLSRSEPDVLPIARHYLDALQSLGDVQVIAQKTRLVCVARTRFAGLRPRKKDFLATFALHRWIDSPRILRREDYGPRWRGHVVAIGSIDEVDDELRSWLQESHDIVGMQAADSGPTGISRD